MNRRQVVALVMAAAASIGTTGASGGCDPDTGAGTATGPNNPLQKELPHNHHVYIEVQWEPGSRPVEVSWTIAGQFHPYKTFSHSPFTMERLQGDEEIAVHARQTEQGYLRVSIEVDGVEMAHDATNEFHGSADANHKPTHGGTRA